jgi:ABC-type branched-subunit amino acid transport system substrate-binding protein
MLTALLALPALAQSDNTTQIIAVITAQSGADAVRDQRFLAAAQWAVAQANEDGIEASDGTRYILEIREYSAASADSALTAFRDARDDGAVAVLGPSVVSFRDAVLAAGTPAIPLIYFARDNANPQNAVKLAGDLSDMVNAAADYWINERGYSQIAILNADTSTAQSGATAFENAARAANIAIRLEHAADETDFGSDARSVRDADADAVVLWTLDAPGAAALKALDDVGFTGDVMVMELDGGFIRAAGSNLSEGLYGPALWAPDAWDEQSRVFTAALSERFGSTIDDETAAYADAVSLIAEALRRSKSVTRLTLSSATIEGLSGTISALSPDTVRLFQVDSSGAMIEAARYVGGQCVACLDTFVEDVRDASPARDAVFSVGLLMTDDDAGRLIEQAAELAVRDINDAGGFIGPQNIRYTMRLRSYSVSTAADTAAASRQAVTDGASVVIGPDSNVQILPNAFLADTLTVPQITTATALTSASLATLQFLLQGRANDLTMARAAVDYAVNVSDIEQLAAFVIRADYGLDAQRAIRDAVRNADSGRLVLTIEHPYDAPDFPSYAAQIVASGAQGVLAWTTPAALDGLLAALAEAEWQGTIFYGYPTESVISSQVVPDGITLLGTLSWNPAGDNWATRSFSHDYQDLYGEAPNASAAATYDAIHLLRLAASEIGITPAALRTWLREDAEFNGVQGRYAPGDFDTGELAQSVWIGRLGAGYPADASYFENGACLYRCAAD